MPLLRIISVISTVGTRDNQIIDPRVALPTQGRYVHLINGLRGIAATYATAPQSIITCQRFKGEDYPVRISCAHPLPEKGRIAIYGLIDPSNDEVFYIGQTVNFIHRMRNHCANRGLNDYRTLASDRRKQDIADKGMITHAIVFCYADDKIEADYLERLTIRAFWETTLNNRAFGTTRPAYRTRQGRS
jgi:hypothetical protein